MGMPAFLSHRSRIRRRGARHRTSPALAGRVLSLLLFFPSFGRAYMGPTHCTKPGHTAAAVLRARSSAKGYSTFNHLLFDLVSVSRSFQSGMTIPDERLTFKICRGAVIDLDDSSLPLGFLPIEVPRTTLQCGDSGRRGQDPRGSDGCVVRGGGKRDAASAEWSYKNSAAGILGGGGVAQVYVYGESAYEVTLRGLTFDNSVTEREARMYGDFVAQFGEEALGGGDVADFGADGSAAEIKKQYDAAVPTEEKAAALTEASPPAANSWGGADQLKKDDPGHNDAADRRLQGQVEDKSIKPSHRFASVAVRGKGYGDDAGPRLLTVEDCRFDSHRGYAVLVSPGIRRPDLPAAPKFDFARPGPGPPPPSGAGNDVGAVGSVNLQSSGQIYNGGLNDNGGPNNNGGGNDNEGGNENEDGENPGRRWRGRRLNLLENGGKYIPEDGFVSYYDHAADRNYLDGRRVKIDRTEFANNRVAGDNVAGLVTSAYSLTLTDCLFQRNDAKAMVFVYNDEAIVDDTIFADNVVEVSTVVMASPRGGAPVDVATTKNGETIAPEPTHIVERTCFLGARVGMSNVLVTDVERTGFGQRENHAAGTEFSWVSTCEGGAAERLGHDCLETGRCDGTCVQFTSGRCMAKRANSREYARLFSAGSETAKRAWAMGTTVALAVVLGTGVFF